MAKTPDWHAAQLPVPFCQLPAMKALERSVNTRFALPDTGAPTLTGSRASGAALQNLITLLATIGLLVDSTTA